MVESYLGNLLVLRHADADEYGELSGKGIAQAEEAGERVNVSLRELEVSASEAQIVTGPPRRLVHTAEIIARVTNIPYAVIPTLSYSHMTRRLAQPSPEYDEVNTKRDVLRAIGPLTMAIIAVVHNEMMNDFAAIHALASETVVGDYENCRGYLITSDGKYQNY
jgi:phosphohistidine phosphatase SixA